MIIVEDDSTVLLNSKNVQNVRKTYIFEDEKFEFVIIQNNVNLVAGINAPIISEVEFLDKAFDWYQSYLKWENENYDIL